MDSSTTSQCDSLEKAKHAPSPNGVMYFPTFSGPVSTQSSQASKESEFDKEGNLKLPGLLASKNYEELLSIYTSYGTVVNRCLERGIELTRSERQAIMSLAWRARPVVSDKPRRNEPSPKIPSRSLPK